MSAQTLAVVQDSGLKHHSNRRDPVHANRPLWISTGESRYDRNNAIKVDEFAWEGLVKRLSRFKVTRESFKQYQTAGNDKLKIKDVGWFVGGQFDPPRRHKANLKFRSVLTLDMDHMDPWDLLIIKETYGKYAYVAHSSHSHSQAAPRVRLVFPLDRNVTAEEYEPIARAVASWSAIELFDVTTYQFSRVMFWPSRSMDGAEYLEVNEGEWLSADEILETYKDWTDWECWPRSSREDSTRPTADKSEDPFTKKGIIGAFCRAFPIDLAIEKFDLPYEESGTAENRYTFSEGSSVDGAIFYEDDGHLYSWHESDPARGNHNAWDLVRIHRFGKLDEGIPPDTPIGDRESQRQMMAWAASLPEVVAELAVKEFAHLAEDDSADESGLGAKAPRLDYETVANKISTLESPTFKACDSLLTQIVAFRGTAAEEGSLLKSLKSHWPDPAPTLADLRTTAKERRKQLVGRTTAEGLSEDIEKALINECLAEHYQNGSTIRRVAKLFWTYESGLWSKDDSERVEGALQSTLLRLREERPEDTAALVAAAGDVRTSAVVRPLSSMMARLLAIESVRDDPLGLERRFPLPIINCLNCEIYLTASGKIDVRDHNPANFYTTRIDCEYSADAPLPREWMRFCKMIFSEYDDPTDMQRHLEEMMGYIIQKSRWLRSWILFHGPTGTGKTTVGDVLKSLLGRAALETDIRALDPTKDKFAFMGLIGKLMVIDDDMTKGALLPDGTLKKLSEEKAMWTDIKYGEGVSFINRATPVLLSNHWPATRDLSDALRDRALVFEFNHQIVRKERSDERKVRMITRERAGILRRLVNALSRLRARGDFKVPAGCRDAHAMWVQHSNPLTRFLADCVVLKDEIPLIKCAKATDVWHSYTTWSISNVDRRYRLTKGSFYESMGQLGVLRTRSRDGTFRMAGVASVSLDEDN